MVVFLFTLRVMKLCTSWKGGWHCYRDEDFMGEIKALARKVHRFFCMLSLGKF